MTKEEILKETAQLIPIREMYACAALTGLLSNPKYFNPSDEKNMIVEGRIFERAFSMADGMIEQSKK